MTRPAPILTILSTEQDLLTTSYQNFIKLYILLQIFVTYNISIKPTKIIFNNPNLGLFGQEVNTLYLTTVKEKLNIIKLF